MTDQSWLHRKAPTGEWPPKRDGYQYVSAMAMRGKSLSEKLLMRSRVDLDTGCILWTGVTRRGYGQFRHDGKMYGAHRAAWEVAHGSIPAGMHVCHRCDVPGCINPDHLWLGTHDENMADMFAKKRRQPPRGERQHLAKLTEKNVREIRKASQAGESRESLVRRYGVGKSAIAGVLTGKTWRHVQ